MPAYKILLMGASYGSLLASKLLFGGHSIHLVCLPAEAELINAEGFKVKLPVRGRKEPVLLESRKLPGKVTAGGAAGVRSARRLSAVSSLNAKFRKKSAQRPTAVQVCYHLTLTVTPRLL